VNPPTNLSNYLWRGTERLARGSASLDPHIAASARCIALRIEALPIPKICVRLSTSSSCSPTNQIHLFMKSFIPTTTVVLSAYLDGIERIFQAGGETTCWSQKGSCFDPGGAMYSKPTTVNAPSASGLVKCMSVKWCAHMAAQHHVPIYTIKSSQRA
jgi:hypothetical protein